MKLSFITKIGAFLFFLFIGTMAKATEYYADANTTSSTQNGTQASPFKTIAQVNGKMSSFQPGDIIYFKRGGTFTGTLNVTRSGTAAAPITFSNYGSGALPIFTGAGRALITIYGKNYITVDGINMTDLNMDPNDHYAEANTQVGVEAEGQYLVIKNCELTLLGAGINLSGDYCTIDKNSIGNLRMIKNTPVSQNSDDDYGASPIIVSGAYSNITSNTFKECWAYSYDYGYDGGGVEFYGSGTNGNKIMYNTAINCNGFMEFGSSSGGTSNDNLVAYNLLINCGDLVYINSSGQYAITANNLQFYNNVLVETVSQFTGTQQMVIIGTNSSVVMKNNIFWLMTGVDVARSGIFTQAKNIHQDNIYRLGTGSVLNFTLDPTEIVTTAPIFTSTTGHPSVWNYNPITGSPAIDFGQNVGMARDFAGISVAGNNTPNAGILEGSATTPTTPLAATSTAPAVNCKGGTTTVTVAATGGTGPYTGTGNFTKPAGTHTFTVTDATGATATTSVVVTEPLQSLSAVLSAGAILVNGGVTAITTVAAGGTLPYTYSFNNGAFQTQNIFSGVGAGTHTITVKDAKNCTVNEVITITQPGPVTPPPTPLVVTSTAGTINCNGESVTVNVSATGGTAPYTGTGSFTRAAGTYTFTVTDAAGVSNNTTITIAEPAVLTGDLTSGTIATYGGTTTVTAAADGGTAPYTYKLNNGTYQSSNTFSNVTAGTHTVIIKDAKNCTVTKNITITQPAAPVTLLAAATAGTISCNGGNTTVTVTATGGTTPYTGTGTFTRAAGTYTFTVTDAAGASANTTITIAQPTVLTGSITSGTIAVYGGTTTLTATAGGGTAPYTYKLNNGTYQSSNTFSNVAAGTHTVTIMDAKNCTVVKNITITQPAAPVTLLAAATAGTISCNGGTTTVTVTATGGTQPYTGTGTFTRGAGTYTFTVTDAAGQTADVNIAVTEPTVLSVSLSAGTIAVNGGTTTVTSTPAGGTNPFTYRLNNGAYQSSATFTGVVAGTYTVTVKDANGCTAIKDITITQPAPVPPLVASVTAGTISCNGGTTTVTVSATGGTAPYTGTGNFTRGADTYTFMVTDANGLTDEVTITVAEPTPLVINLVSGTITVNGGTTTLTANASGGTTPYTYRLNNGAYQSSNVFNNVAAGSYTVTVKDANGCTLSRNRTISQPGAPPPLIAAATAGTISCNGGTTTVTVTATGGTGSYTGTGTFTKAAGTHTFVVTDASGVTDNVSITIAQPSAINVTVVNGAIAVNGGTTTATVTAAGGTPGYTYSYDNGAYQSSNIFNNVTAGAHSIRVKDTKGCIGLRNITVSQPAPIPALVVTATATAIACNGGTASVTVAATGGVGPYTGTGIFIKAAGTHTFTVTDANGTTASQTITIAQPTTISIGVATGTITVYGGSTTATVTATGGTPGYTYSYDNGTYQASNTLSTVTAGAHTIRVKDSKGCIATRSFTVTQPAATPTLVAAATAGTITCNGGTTSVTVTATGGTAPYNGTGSFTKAAGTHTFTVTDANGVTDDVTITIAQPAAINISYSSTPITEFGGMTTITVTATGGTPGYTYRIGNGTYQSSNVFEEIGAGNHTLVVKDSKGCASSKIITITQPDRPLSMTVNTTDVSCKGTDNGSARITARGGAGSYRYSLNGGQFGTSNLFTNLPAGTHTLSVKDSLQRTVSTQITLGASKKWCNKIYLIAMGNPVPNEFRVKIETESTEPIYLTVMNMNGQLVYQGRGKANDINIFGKEFPQGTFIAKVMQGTQTETIRLVKAH